MQLRALREGCMARVSQGGGMDGKSAGAGLCSIMAKPVAHPDMGLGATLSSIKLFFKSVLIFPKCIHFWKIASSFTQREAGDERWRGCSVNKTMHLALLHTAHTAVNPSLNYWDFFCR